MRYLVLALAVLLLAVLVASCVIRWRGQDVLGLDPDADVRIDHPQRGATNSSR